MPLQGEYEPSTAEWVNKQVTEYEGSGGTAGTLLRGVPTVVVTMVGASTGKLRKHPVMRGRARWHVCSGGLQGRCAEKPHLGREPA